MAENLDFHEADYPELGGVFRSIDVAIAALVAADPAFRPKAARKRPVRSEWSPVSRSQAA